MDCAFDPVRGFLVIDFSIIETRPVKFAIVKEFNFHIASFCFIDF